MFLYIKRDCGDGRKLERDRCEVSECWFVYIYEVKFWCDDIYILH